jgi:hypothetical protein
MSEQAAVLVVDEDLGQSKRTLGMDEAPSSAEGASRVRRLQHSQREL